MLNLISESGGLTLVRDEMERWSVYEANLFEEALDKTGKDFAQIREQTFPWKTLESIIELVIWMSLIVKYEWLF